MGLRTKVLVAVSDRDVISVLEPLLARESLEYSQVANGEACLVLASTTPYDLILAHLPLIDMSAPTLLSGLQAPGSPSHGARVLLLSTGGQAAAIAALRPVQLDSVKLTDSIAAFRTAVAEALGVALRASARTLVNLHVDVDDSRATRVYETENLSTSGMLLRTGHPLAVGTEFAFDLCLSEPDLVLQGKGRVVRHTVPDHEKVFGMGVRFEDLDGEAATDLHLFVRQHLGPSV